MWGHSVSHRIDVFSVIFYLKYTNCVFSDAIVSNKQIHCHFLMTLEHVGRF